ncbi:MAG: hypothetical protein JHC87_00315 [Thermoleophilaceae bacterium]|nr:hypothetical protein [Thermoleophilaceae bacterium]
MKTLEPQQQSSQSVTENTFFKRVLWSGLMATVGVISSVVANRIATTIWAKVFDEEPPFGKD